MGLADLFRRLLSRGPGIPVPEEKQRLAALSVGLHDGTLDPPRDMHDPGAWDVYWRNHWKHDFMMQAMIDVMTSDPWLPAILTQRGSKTILCAGNGVSRESTSLALLGFNVTSLDISSVPEEVFSRIVHDPDHPIHQIPGCRVRDDGSVVFGDPGLIDPGLCPSMHRSPEYLNKGGGSLSFVTGDLIKADVCPGPFDVVLERRTLQLFQGVDQIEALDRMVMRLGSRALFVSHQHEGRAKPGDAGGHYAEPRLKSQGFAIHWGSGPAELNTAPRLAYLISSTG